MRVLLVEDNADYASEVEREVRSIQGCELVWSASRDSALHRIDSDEDFCLVILDRRIPTADGVLDDHFEHGWRVFQAIRTRLAGTPVWFLTGTEDPDFAADLANDYARQADLNGRQQPDAMYRVFWKRRIVDCMRALKEFAEQHLVLEQIAISGPPEMRLRDAEARTIRLFGRRHRGANVDVQGLGGGLSDSRVLRVAVRSADGRPLITTVAKVSSLSETADEAERYRTEISRLRAGGFPQLTEKIDAGAGNTGGLFYGLVGETIESAFDRIRARRADLDGIPPSLRAIMQPWYAAKRVVDVQVSQIRRKFIGDTSLPRVQGHLDGLDIAAAENCLVRAAECCQHCDLHCANIVFDERGQPMLIDFGDTGLSFASVDPVTMELSTVFHSQRSLLPGDWPTAEHFRNWTNVEQFVRGCSFPRFITACREWAQAEAGSTDEIVAVAYGYGLRQLKYDDTDKELARALLQNCIEHFSNRAL